MQYNDHNEVFTILQSVRVMWWRGSVLVLYCVAIIVLYNDDEDGLMIISTMVLHELGAN